MKARAFLRNDQVYNPSGKANTTNGLVLWAKMNKGFGTNIQDYSSYHATGTLGAAATWQTGSANMQYGSVQLALNGSSSTQNATASVSSLYTSDVLSYNDYYPFGMLESKRNRNANSYKYGLQGQEKDDEIRGSGNSINYKYRMHDARIGRFLLWIH